MNPFVLFHNIFDEYAPTASSEAAGFPDDNIIDWRVSTPYRWKADTTTTPINISLDAGSGNTVTADTVIFAGHNLSSIAAKWRVTAGTPNPTANVIVDYLTPTDNMPYCVTFTEASWRQWQFRIDTDTALSAAPQIGIIIIGKRLEWEEGAQPDLDPYGEEYVMDRARNEHGAPLGANVNYVGKRFTINHTNIGMTVSGFYDASSGKNWDDHFAPHLRQGLPFWFVWNSTTDPRGVYLCTTDRVGMPHVTGTTTRRGLVTEFMGYREVS